MSAKPRFTLAGITTDGRQVVSGADVFFNHDTCGLSLADQLTIFGEERVVDWVSFYAAANAAKWKHERIIARVRENVCDSVGKEYAGEIIDRLNRIYCPGQVQVSLSQ